MLITSSQENSEPDDYTSAHYHRSKELVLAVPGQRFWLLDSPRYNVIMDKLLQEVTESLRRVGNAHHRAFIMVNGRDADWARWYAEKLEPELAGKLAVSLTADDLAALLPLLEKERSLRAPEAEWAGFYAEAIVDRYG